MKFGVREICDVVLKAKAAQKIGNKIFYKNEPVIYFDTLKTSSMEGAATTVYAQGGRGNARLVAWEGERTVTFTMEDALISPEGFMILSGAGLIEAGAGHESSIKQHITETVDKNYVTVTGDGETATCTIKLSRHPYLPTWENDNFAYVMFVKDGEIISEPFIPEHTLSRTAKAEGDGYDYTDSLTKEQDGSYIITVKKHNDYIDNAQNKNEYSLLASRYGTENVTTSFPDNGDFDSVIVDYYVEREGSGNKQIEITADKFGGNYYLEASTLFRDQNGVDMPAEFIIPNCKIQSNFTFTMASSGDPSTFTFTMDAFPDYTRFDHSKKVLAAIQIIEEGGSANIHRTSTVHAVADDSQF